MCPPQRGIYPAVRADRAGNVIELLQRIVLVDETAVASSPDIYESHNQASDPFSGDVEPGTQAAAPQSSRRVRQGGADLRAV